MARIFRAEAKPEHPPLPPEIALAEVASDAFNAYVNENGDMETDTWARKNFNAGFYAGYAAKGK